MEHIRNLTFKEIWFVVLLSFFITGLILSFDAKSQTNINQKNIVMTPENQRYLQKKQYIGGCILQYEINSQIELAFISNTDRNEVIKDVRNNKKFNDGQKEYIINQINFIYNTGKVGWSEEGLKSCLSGKRTLIV